MLAFAKQGDWLEACVESDIDDFWAFSNEESFLRLESVAELGFRERTVCLKLLGFQRGYFLQIHLLNTFFPLTIKMP